MSHAAPLCSRRAFRAQASWEHSPTPSLKRNTTLKEIQAGETTNRSVERDEGHRRPVEQFTAAPASSPYTSTAGNNDRPFTTRLHGTLSFTSGGMAWQQ